MPRKRFTNEQNAFALRQAENGATVGVNGKLKRLVADLTLDCSMPQDVLKRKW